MLFERPPHWPRPSSNGSGPAGTSFSFTREDREQIPVLLVDDDPTLLKVCRTVLEDEGYPVEACDSARAAMERLAQGTCRVAVLDLHLPHRNGVELIQEGLRANPQLISIIMTERPSVETSLDALSHGAVAYLPKPFSAQNLKLAVGQAAALALALGDAIPGTAHADGVASPALAVGDVPSSGRILGKSPALQRVLTLAGRAAATDASVFISGESGTGKELIAQLIHERSLRADKPLLAINCAALPEALLESEMFGHRKGSFTGAVKEHQGLLEAANGGTLFLDELTEMPLSIQAKLLRVIQDGKVRRVGSDRVDALVNVRFIAATNRNPAEAVQNGVLREDLYYRLRVVPIVMPALRERQDDIPLLAEHFLKLYWARHRDPAEVPPTLAPETLDALRARSWPGNVRELQNLMEHIVVMAEAGAVLGPADLPRESHGVRGDGVLDPAMFLGGTYHESRQELTDQFERGYLKWVIGRAEGNLSEAARIAEVDRTTLYRLMEKHDLGIRRQVQEDRIPPASDSAS
jgi:DNA-binding NtrC family response regulator